MHGSPVLSRPIARAGLGLVARTAAHVPQARIMVSQALADDFRASFGVAGVVIPNGVAAPAAPEGDGDGHVLAELGVRPGRFLLHVGRLVPEKAADDLLAAYRDVPGDLALVVVGGSPAHLEVLGADGPGRRLTRAGDRDERRRALVRFVEGIEAGEEHDPTLRPDVVQNYSWDRITDRTEAAYTALLGTGASASERDLEPDLGTP